MNREIQTMQRIVQENTNVFFQTHHFYFITGLPTNSHTRYEEMKKEKNENPKWHEV